MADNIQPAKEAHWALYHQFEQIALEIEKAPLMQKQAGVEKLVDLVSSTLVTHEQTRQEHIQQIADLQTVVMALSQQVYGVPVEVEGEADVKS